MTAPGYAAYVTAGGTFLDGQVPTWPWDVDLATLNLHDACGCILGQLGGDYAEMREDLHLSQADAVELGFALPDGASWEDWAELDAAWAREIVTRREAGQVTT